MRTTRSFLLFLFRKLNWKKNQRKKLVFSRWRWLSCTFEKQLCWKCHFFLCIYNFGDYGLHMLIKTFNNDCVVFVNVLIFVSNKNETTLQREHYEAMRCRLMTFRMRTSTRFVFCCHRERIIPSTHTHIHKPKEWNVVSIDASRFLFLTNITPAQNFHIVVISKKNCATDMRNFNVPFILCLKL